MLCKHGSQQGILKQYYVWDINIRVFHWINALYVLALGLIILNSKTFGIAGDAKIELKTGIHIQVTCFV